MQQFVDNLRWQLGQLDLSIYTTVAPRRFDLLEYASIAKNEAANDNALLSVWVVVSKERAVLYLYDAKKQSLRARTWSPSNSPLVAAEELAIITRSAIVARLEGDSEAMAEIPLPTNDSPRATSPAPTSRPTAPPPRPPPTHTKLAFGLRASVLSGFPVENRGLWPGAGLSAWLWVERFRVGLGYGFYPETTLRTDQTVIALRRHPLEINIGYELYRGKVLALAEAFTTFDRLHRTTLDAPEPLEVTTQSRRWLTSLGLRGRGELPLGGPIALSFALGAEWVTNAYDFETSFDGKRKKTSSTVATETQFRFRAAVALRMKAILTIIPVRP